VLGMHNGKEVKLSLSPLRHLEKTVDISDTIHHLLLSP
jgi:hypothetical protein